MNSGPESTQAIPIPERQVAPLDSFAPRIHGLRISFVNVFAVANPDGSWVLIDTGLPYSDGFIRRWANANFPTPPKAIFLSHGHFDHVSGAASLASHWDVPVFASELEIPYLNGEREYAPPNAGAGGGLMTLLSPLLPRGPVNLGGRLCQVDIGEDISSLLPSWKILHTPGHTPGHLSFFREEDRVLLPADAFCTTKPESFFEAAITQNPELHGPPSYFTSDWAAAKQSVQELAALEPLTIAPGHGRPITGADIPAALNTLAVRFDEIAVPENRKSAAAD